MSIIYVTDLYDGPGKTSSCYRYEQNGDTVTKSRVTSMKFFNGDENVKEKSVREVDSWNINDPNMPGWLKKYLE